MAGYHVVAVIVFSVLEVLQLAAQLQVVIGEQPIIRRVRPTLPQNDAATAEICGLPLVLS